MLYILFTSIILIPALAGFGAVFQYFFGKFWDGISSALIAGIFSVSICFSVLAFFIPLNIDVEVIAIIAGWLAFFYFKEYHHFWKFFAENKVGFSIFSLVILFFGSYFPFILDHFGYYVPTIKWISEVGLVKGISNLDLLLVQMSVWHIFQAGFSNFSDPFLRINSLLLIIYLVYIFEKKSWIHLIFLPVLFLFSQSPSTDLPVIVFSLIILNEIIQLNKNSTLIFAFSVFVFTIKPTMIWLPILSFLYFIRDFMFVPKKIIPATLVLSLYLFKNLWTFGFPIFPVQVFDLGLSWKPNPEVLKSSAEMARLKTYDMQYTYSEIMNFSKFNEIKNWLFLKGIKSKINISFVLVLIIFFVFSLKKNSRTIWLVFISVLIKSLLVLSFSAQYRFFADVFFASFFVMFKSFFTRDVSIFLSLVISLVIGIFLSFPKYLKTVVPSFKLGYFMTGFTATQIFEPAVYSPSKFKTYTVGNFTFNVVNGYIFSYETPLPAISPEYIRKGLNAGYFPQMIGKSIEKGFVWKKISAEEKLQIQKIIDDYDKSNQLRR